MKEHVAFVGHVETAHFMYRSDGARQEGIQIRPMGGLGNQLFIYAAGKALALKNKCPLEIDTSWYDLYGGRNCQLNLLDNDSNTYFLTDPETPLAKKIKKLKMQVQWRLPAVASILQRQKVYKANSLGFDPHVMEQPCNSLILGYFQSWKYFESESELLRCTIMHMPIVQSAEREALPQDLHSSGFIAVHVRRGDYMQAGLNKFHGVIGIEYYKKAMKYLHSRIDAKYLVIFSDDPPFAVNMAKKIAGSLQIVQAPTSFSDLDTLRLMSKASAMVTANSTFSWWGAWLGDNPSRPVICPTPWNRISAKENNDLLLPDWLPIHA